MARLVLTESKVYLKAIELETGDGGYLIGNCNMDIGLKDVVVRVIPPINENEDGEAIILNGTYNNEEFEEYLGSELRRLPFYFFGKINMDIRAPGTVWKFFPKRYEDENVLVINQTQMKESYCNNCNHSDGSYHKNGEKCTQCGETGWHTKKLVNPLEVKIFMKRRDLKQAM